MDSNTLFKKEYFLNYIGNISFHHSYSKSMIPWLISKVIVSNKSLSTYCCLNLDHNGIFVKKEEMNLTDLNNRKSNNKTVVESTSVSSLSFSSNDDSLVSSACDDHVIEASLDQLIENASLKQSGKAYFFVIVNSSEGADFTLFLFHHCDSVMVRFVEIYTFFAVVGIYN